jgi:hypothetical protein
VKLELNCRSGSGYAVKTQILFFLFITIGFVISSAFSSSLGEILSVLIVFWFIMCCNRERASSLIAKASE